MEQPEIGGSSLRPLDGLRILDFSNSPAGAQATQTLADFAAEVIHVEPPGSDTKIAGRTPCASGLALAVAKAESRLARAVREVLRLPEDQLISGPGPCAMAEAIVWLRQNRTSNRPGSRK